MVQPTKLHEIQHLAGRVADLSRFIGRLGEKGTSILCTHEELDKKIEWTEEADQAFSYFKKVLSTPPVLVAPNEKEPLLLYIAGTHQVVITVLVFERSEDEKTQGFQRMVYFLGKVLSPSKQFYPHYQKLAYSVFMTARKLRHYYAVHPIIVVNKAPLSNILNNPEATSVSPCGESKSPPGHHV
jgi:hypothetical protein